MRASSPNPSSPSTQATPELLTPNGLRLQGDVQQASASVVLVRGLSEMVAAGGVDPQAFLQAAGVPPGQLDAAPGDRLPYARIVEMIELALDMTGDPGLGIRWATGSTQRSFGPLSHLLMHVPSLREALTMLARYFPLFSDRRAYAVVDEGPRLRLRYLPLSGESARVRRFVSEMVIGGFSRFFRFYNPQAPLGPVTFQHEPPPHRDLYVHLFGESVRFGQPCTELQFDASLLDTPSPQRDDELRDTLLGLVEHRAMRLDRRIPLSRRVLELLSDGAELPDMAAVARQMGMSARTLRRRLTDEGVIYDDLRAQAQHRKAQALLRDPAVPLQEVAFVLGFAHASTFHRAFKRWSGMTPGAYRKAQLGD